MNPVRPEVRPATPADVPAVLPMVEAICTLHAQRDPERYATLPDVLERYARWLPARARDERSVFLIADIQTPGATALTQAGALAGFVIGTVESTIPIYRVSEVGFIHDLWVDPSARRLGVARALIHAATARFAAIGVQQVRLETAAWNEPAQRLFESCGFRAATLEMIRPSNSDQAQTPSS